MSSYHSVNGDGGGVGGVSRGMGYGPGERVARPLLHSGRGRARLVTGGTCPNVRREHKGLDFRCQRCHMRFETQEDKDAHERNRGVLCQEYRTEQEDFKRERSNFPPAPVSIVSCMLEDDAKQEIPGDEEIAQLARQIKNLPTFNDLGRPMLPAPEDYDQFSGSEEPEYKRRVKEFMSEENVRKRLMGETPIYSWALKKQDDATN